MVSRVCVTCAICERAWAGFWPITYEFECQLTLLSNPVTIHFINKMGIYISFYIFHFESFLIVQAYLENELT
jgi:hypothetical protein